ncbi:MAG TPA: hypothetical protein PLG17_01755, partial [Thermodesulfobacteriota bacterium]|nr:hypothetical protein [Thermodesulfobacteriota bacterium]HOC39201.1 hypothetical protein [Thermodesulfobacteriota bacterium]HQO77216.1 hypothetical protein [Thermodesulfobacteriota bacterium]
NSYASTLWRCDRGSVGSRRASPPERYPGKNKYRFQAIVLYGRDDVKGFLIQRIVNEGIKGWREEGKWIPAFAGMTVDLNQLVGGMTGFIYSGHFTISSTIAMSILGT